MDYKTVRPLIKSGDLLAYTHRSWKSWTDIKIQLVRFFTQSEYSHVGLAYVMDGRVFVLEAVQPLVRIFPLSKTGDFYYLPLPSNWTEDVAEFAISHVGEPYSQLQAIQAFFRPLKHDGLWECAELALSVLSQSGINLGNKATPTAIVREAMQQGATCSLISNP